MSNCLRLQGDNFSHKETDLLSISLSNDSWRAQNGGQTTIWKCGEAVFACVGSFETDHGTMLASSRVSLCLPGSDRERDRAGRQQTLPSLGTKRLLTAFHGRQATGVMSVGGLLQYGGDRNENAVNTLLFILLLCYAYHSNLAAGRLVDNAQAIPQIPNWP